LALHDDRVGTRSARLADLWLQVQAPEGETQEDQRCRDEPRPQRFEAMSRTVLNGGPVTAPD
jgi:hypothetical protein